MDLISKIPFASKLTKWRVDEIHRMFNGFKGSPKDIELPFEMDEVVKYFAMRDEGLDTIQIAYNLGCDTASLCMFRFNGFETTCGLKVEYNEMKSLVKCLS